MSKSSAAQRKPAPRKSAPQQPEPQTSQKPNAGRGQSNKNQAGKGQSSKAVQGKSASGKPQVNRPVVRQRGSLMTAAIILAALGTIISAALPVVYHKAAYAPAQPVIWGSALVIALLGLAGVYGLWQWKRWGIYLVAAAAVVAIGVGLAVFPQPALALQAIIPLLVLFLALRTENAFPQFS
ncbi:MAG: hypothetical protein WAZ19_00720 [Anaerolineae bacterium]